MNKNILAIIYAITAALFYALSKSEKKICKDLRRSPACGGEHPKTLLHGRFSPPHAALFFQIRAVHPNCGPVADNRVVHMVMAQAEIAPGGKVLGLGHAHAV